MSLLILLNFELLFPSESLRLMDYDTYSANDAIGKVYLDLNPLLINSTKTKGTNVITHVINDHHSLML